MKKNITLLGIASLLVSLGVTGCDKTVNVNKVEDFTFNFVTGEYNFKAVKDVSYYYVRVYSQSSIDSAKQTAEENEFEYNLVDASPSVAKRIRVRDLEQTEYTGELDISDFAGGEKYYAYVYTYTRTDDGDVNYAVSEIDVSGIFKATYATVAVDKGSVSGITAEYVDENDDKKADDGKISVTFTSDFLTTATLDFAPTYVINVYDGNKKVASASLPNSEIEEKRTESESSGNVTVTVTAEGSKTIDVGQADLTNYTITVTIVSTDAQAYYDSAESDKINVTKHTDQPAGGDQGGGNQGGGQGSGS